jgi:hypothetical protein
MLGVCYSLQSERATSPRGEEREKHGEVHAGCGHSHAECLLRRDPYEV